MTTDSSVPGSLRSSFDELSKEMSAQRLARETLRTRAIAILSAGAVVFALTRSPSTELHLDAWLVASLMVLVAMGFCVALVLAPAPIWTVAGNLDPESIAASVDAEADEKTEQRFYGDLILSISDGIDENRTWFYRVGLPYFTSTVLLVVEIALIAAHFSSGTGYRIAISVVTACFLGLIAAFPARSLVKAIHMQKDTVFPDRFWKLAKRVPLLGRVVKGRLPTELVSGKPIESLRLPPPVPGLDLEPPPQSQELEQAIQSKDKESILKAFRQASVFALGEPAGDVVGGVSGTESTLVHYAVARPDGREITLLPVFTGPRFLIEPLRDHPEWQIYGILEIEGRALFENVDEDVTIVINPGSPGEFQIGPADR